MTPLTCGFWLTLMLLFFSFAMPSRAEAPLSASSWNGEYFGKHQGAVYFKIGLKDFPASAQTKFLTGSIQVTVVDLLKHKSYVISYSLQDVDEAPRDLWKFSSGKYAVASIVMIDTFGVRRTYRGVKGAKSFTVKRQCVSNLGIWTISPTGKDGLTARFDMAPNSYRETGDKAGSSVAAVLDGFTGLMQEKIGGKKVQNGAEANYADGEMRTTVTFTRQISMFFKLDLMRHNVHAPSIAQVLQVYDAPFRLCYTDRLEVNDALKGDVTFTFLLSKSTGTMAKIKQTGGSLNDPKLAQCLYYELAQIQFPVPENMIGELTYIYDVR